MKLGSASLLISVLPHQNANIPKELGGFMYILDLLSAKSNSTFMASHRMLEEDGQARLLGNYESPTRLC